MHVVTKTWRCHYSSHATKTTGGQPPRSPPFPNAQSLHLLDDSALLAQHSPNLVTGHQDADSVLASLSTALFKDKVYRHLQRASTAENSIVGASSIERHMTTRVSEPTIWLKTITLASVSSQDLANHLKIPTSNVNIRSSSVHGTRKLVLQPVGVYEVASQPETNQLESV